MKTFNNLAGIIFSNKMKLTKFIILIFLTSFSITFSQQGTGKITGIIVDADFGDVLIGANVLIEGSSIGAASDMNGNYSISGLSSGNYNLIFSMIGFTRKVITGIEVKVNEVTKLNVSLKTETYETEEVVITAEVLKNTDAGMLINRQKSKAVSDAISSEQFSRSGAGDAAEAVKQVVGASVVDGKYVYIRGLGERYSSTQLNGAELPSSDPNKKAFQMDLLPSNLLDNIVTLKTFTPDKPGNFSGGIVDIGTKAFPNQFTFKLSTSTSYNTYTTFNKNNITYNGVGGNFLGFDDGIRDIPNILQNFDSQIPVPQEARFDSEKAKKIDDASKSFNNVMDFTKSTVPMNSNLGLSVGNEILTGEESSFGYLGSLNFSRNFSFYDDGKIGRYSLTGIDSKELSPNLLLNDTKSTAESNLGGLANLSYRFSKSHQLHTNFFYSKTGESETRFMEGGWPQEFGVTEDAPIYFNRVLAYTEREIQSLQFSGEHYFESILGSRIEWNYSNANTTQVEPDRRLLTTAEQRFEDRTNYIITGSGFDNPSRYYRDLEDNSNSYSLNIKIPFKQWNDKRSEFKFGGFYQSMDRDFNERIFSYQVDNRLFNELQGDITTLFSDEYLGIVSIDTLSNGNTRYTFGNTLRDNSKLRNQYNGEQEITAFYAMFELPLLNRLNIIAGARYEITNLKLISSDPTVEDGKISEKDILPSINLIYNLSENMNLRGAYTKTLARPTFREIAPFSSKEFVNDSELMGNPTLERTLITNYDLRWEWFTNPGEVLAVSGFYKFLNNPIEIAFAEGSTRSNQIVNYVNVDKAEILGAELETRFGLKHFTEFLSNFYFSSNLTILKSSVDIAPAELTQRRGIDPNADDQRQLQGQSPFILNIGINYLNYESGTTLSLDYNTFGERLSKVSANITPDIFEEPTPLLNINFSQKLFNQFSLKLSAKNILNSRYKESYRYLGNDYVYREYTRGISFGFGIGYEI